MMETEIEKILGTNEGEYWGQIYDVAKDGIKLAVTMGAKKPEGMDPVEVIEWGRKILAKLHEEFFNKEDGGMLERLKSAIIEVEKEYKEVELTGAVFTGKAIYLAANGGRVWVQKGDREGFLINGRQRETKAFSGFGVGGETVVLGNSRFWQQLPEGIVKAAAEKGEESGEILTAEIHGGDTKGGEAGIVARIEESKAIEKKEEAVEETLAKPKVSWKERVENILPKRTGPVYVNYEDKTNKRKRTMQAGMALILILIALGVAGRLKTQQTAQKTDQDNLKIEELMEKYNQAVALTGLNSARSRQLAQEVKSGLTTVINKKDPRVAQMEQGLPELEAEVNGKLKSNVSELIDVGMLRQGSTGDVLAWGEGKLAILDRTGNKLMTVDPAKGNGQVLAGEEKLGKAKFLAVYPGKTEVLSDKGIVECKTTNCSTKVKADGEWKDIAGIGMFAGNAYLLDRGSNQIYRYAVTDSGFGGKTKWIGKDETVDFSAASGLAIDGSIWVISDGGKIIKLNRGVVQDFSLSGVDKAIGNAPGIYTDEDAQNLYILDRDNGRVLAVKKTGEYLFQVEANEIKAATGLVVDEANKTVYLCGETKVWKLAWQE